MNYNYFYNPLSHISILSTQMWRRGLQTFPQKCDFGVFVKEIGVNGVSGELG